MKEGYLEAYRIGNFSLEDVIFSLIMGVILCFRQTAV